MFARALVTLLVAVGLLVPTFAQQRPAPPPYRILVSNDDGVRAPALAAVAQILQAIGEVTIVAPMENQSGKGHSIITSEPIYRDDVTLPNGLKAIGLTATPVTAMSVALKNIARPKPDLVVTGINRDLNLGFNAYLSGTLGGAREAAMQGVPAIAASMEASGIPRDLPYASEEVLGVARRVKQWGLPPLTFLSVQIPAMPQGGYKGYRVTTLANMPGGETTFAETRHPAADRTIYWNVYREGATPAAAEGTDIWAVRNGYVSVTPLRVGESDPAQLEALRKIFSQ
jgi:5'-nucleotidase